MFQKKDIKIYLIMLLTSLIMCGGFVTGHYSTDDYNIMNIGYVKYSIQNNLREGRPLMTLIDLLYDKLHISYNVFIISTVVIAIILSCLNIILLYHLLEKYTKKKNKYVIYCILFSSIFHFMYIENLYFVESIVMALSLVLYTLSAKFFFDESKHHYLKATLLATLAIFGYNGLECYYITIIALLSMLKNEKFNKNVILDILKGGGIIIFTVILNYIQMKVACNLINVKEIRAVRTKGLINLLYLIYITPHILINSSYLLPKYVFLIFILSLIILSTSYDIKKHKNITYSTALLILISIFSCFCVGLVSVSSFGTGRLLFGVGMSVGIALLYLYIQMGNKDKIFKYFIITLSIIWTVTNIGNYTYRTFLSKNHNEIEKQEVLTIHKEIEEYEKENNLKVSKIVFVRGKSKEVSDIDAKALKTEWSTVGILNYYSEKNYYIYKTIKKDNGKYLNQLRNRKYLLEDDKLIIETYDW